MGMIFTQGVNEISRDRDLCQPNCLLYKVLWTSINWTDSVLKPVCFCFDKFKSETEEGTFRKEKTLILS